MAMDNCTVETRQRAALQKSEPRCIVCEGRLSFLGKHKEFDYTTCDSCKTVQIAPIPDQSFVESYYSDSKFSTEVHENTDPEVMRAQSRPYYASLAKTLAEHQVRGLVVDYGTGWGGLCEFLLSRGFECRAIELSAAQVKECRRRGLPVEQRSLGSLVTDGVRAKAVVLCGVFEHLADPRTILRDAHALLEDDGLFVSLQPTAPFAQFLAWSARLGSTRKSLPSLFWIFDAPWHIALYSIDGMKQLAEQHGFTLMEVRPVPQGRVKGLYGVIQLVAEIVNKVGWTGLKTDWPLMTSHTFVFRKRSQ